MMTKNMPEITDAELVSRSLEGDRDAFSRIVSRYQILICSLAYNRLGNLGQSEDVAQETFITAWKHLRLLREPEKLRSWLCGIVRNRLHKHVQREYREPASVGDSLEMVHDAPHADALPSEQAIGREEEAILWRALERIPELYREPLILFYRENQSISEVAAQLELSEDAVKQRLSRGRKLLQDEVAFFVESTLRRTAPGQKFSGAVLAALPAGSAVTASAGAVGKGAAVAKGGLLGMTLAALLPFVGILAGLVSQWVFISATSSGRRRWMQMIKITTFFVIVMAIDIGGEYAVCYLRVRDGWSDPFFYLVRTGFWWCMAAGLSAWLVLQLRRIQITQARTAAGENAPRAMSPFIHAFTIAGTHLCMFGWIIALAWRLDDWLAVAMLAGCMIGMGIWNFISVRRQTGAAVSRSINFHMAVYGLVLLMLFNLRLDVWMATARNSNLNEIHALYPQWIVPMLSVAFVLWVVLMWMVTKPARAAHLISL